MVENAIPAERKNQISFSSIYILMVYGFLRVTMRMNPLRGFRNTFCEIRKKKSFHYDYEKRSMDNCFLDTT